MASPALSLIRRIVKTSLELHAQSLWDVFGDTLDFGFDVPGFSRPFVTKFSQGRDGPTLEICETQPTAAAGFQMSIVFVENRSIPREFRRLFRRIGNTPSRGSRSVMVLVVELDGSEVPATPRQEKLALYITTALRKAWDANLLGTEKRADRSRVPLLRLSGPPHDPTIEVSEIRVIHHGTEEITPAQ